MPVAGTPPRPPDPAHDPCYTDPVGVDVHNLTLAIEDDLLLAARKLALEQGTSVNEMVRRMLADLVREHDARRAAARRLVRLMDERRVVVGERTWTRDDLHER
jgi:hypothetical protein